MKKLLVTGISGFIGNCIVRAEQSEWSIYGTYANNKIQYPGLKVLHWDFTEDQDFEQLIKQTKPDAILHLAALSNPNYCELHPEQSKMINLDRSVELARFSKKYNLQFVFASTDLVFDGEQAPYSEDDPPRPLSVYGRHKAEAEQKILAMNPDACVARMPVMFGLPTWGRSFMRSWLQNLRQGKPVFAFTDEFRSKVSGNTAAQGLMLLLNKNANGIWHLGGKERISRYDFAKLMARVFDLPTDLVKASVQAEVKMPAARPADVSLQSKKSV